MQLRTELHTAGTRSPTLLVLLPPSLSQLEDFYQHGFVDALRQRPVAADLWLADVTGQHVLDRTVVSALHTGVVLPARALGYRSIWFAGISMGGFCALHYAAQHAAELAGLCLLAPYPGTGDVLAEIRAAGGAAQWAQSASDPQRDERAWWSWLCGQARQADWKTPVYFGSGNHDRFLRGQRLLTPLLPPERVHEIDGGHDWPTWRALWEHWLDHGPLALSSGYPGPATAPMRPDPTGKENL